MEEITQKLRELRLRRNKKLIQKNKRVISKSKRTPQKLIEEPKDPSKWWVGEVPTYDEWASFMGYPSLREQMDAWYQNNS
jgi:hypothetical protein